MPRCCWPILISLCAISHCGQLIKQMVSETSSGGVTVNDVLVQYGLLSLPFGGVGKSLQHPGSSLPAAASDPGATMVTWQFRNVQLYFSIHIFTAEFLCKKAHEWLQQLVPGDPLGRL